MTIPPSALSGYTQATPPAADVEVTSWVSPWARLLPLWRHAVWGGALFGLTMAMVRVSVDVGQTTAAIDRGGDLIKEATLVGDQLRLELATRRALIQLEPQAAALGLVTDVPLMVVVPE